MNSIQIVEVAATPDLGMAEIMDKHRNAARDLLPSSEPDQYPGQYPAQCGAQYGAQPSLRGVAADERAGDKG